MDKEKVMKEFDKVEYLKSNLWVDNDYLVDPADTAKCCQCCGVRYYTVEFDNCAEFADGKLPVCGNCLVKKGKRYETAVDILSNVDVYMECEKCLETKQFGFFFQQQDGGRFVKNICDECA